MGFAVSGRNLRSGFTSSCREQTSRSSIFFKADGFPDGAETGGKRPGESAILGAGLIDGKGLVENLQVCDPFPSLITQP